MKNSFISTSNKKKYAFVILRLIIFFLLIKLLLIPFQSKNYLSLVVIKHHKLQSIKEREKIIVFGNSTAAFGISAQLLSDHFHKPSLNLGVHGGLGLLNQYEESMPFINTSDLLLWQYDFNQIKNCTSFKSKTTQDFDNQNSFYHLNIRPNFFKLIKSIFIYKIGINDKTGTYRYHKMINDLGDNITAGMHDSEWVMNIKNFWNRPIISKRMIELSNSDLQFFIKKFPLSIKPNSFFIHPPTGRLNNQDKILISKNINICRKHGIKFIINPENVIFDKNSHYYDGFPHLNESSKMIYTKKIIQSLDQIIFN
jgi:hypothetical protein